MTLKTVLNLESKYKLTADEIQLIYMTFLAQEENGSHTEYLKQWLEQCDGQTKLKLLFESLKEKGIIKKNYNPEKFIPDDIEFNQNFLKSWIKQTGELGYELFKEYPSHMLINGKLYPLNNYAKRFINLDEFAFYYSTTIKHSVETHKKVMEMLKYGKEHDLIRFGILEWVASQKWNFIEELKNSGTENLVADSILLED